MIPARRFAFGRTPPPLPAAAARPAQPPQGAEETTEPLPPFAAPAPSCGARPTLPVVEAPAPARPVLPFREPAPPVPARESMPDVRRVAVLPRPHALPRVRALQPCETHPLETRRRRFLRTALPIVLLVLDIVLLAYLFATWRR